MPLAAGVAVCLLLAAWVVWFGHRRYPYTPVMTWYVTHRLYEAAIAYRDEAGVYPDSLASLTAYIVDREGSMADAGLSHMSLKGVVYELRADGPLVTYLGRDRKPGGTFLDADATSPPQKVTWREYLLSSYAWWLLFWSLVMGGTVGYFVHKNLREAQTTTGLPAAWATARTFLLVAGAWYVASIIMGLHRVSGH